MAAGDRCRAKGCEATQPCPLHTSRGKPRRNRRPGEETVGGTVTNLFSEDRKAQVNHDRPEPGTRADRGEPDKRQNEYVKQRLGKRWSQIHREVAEEHLYSWDDFVEGLDAGELARGQLRDKHQKFSGRPPEFIPRAFYLACQREMIKRFNFKMQSNLEVAADELVRLGTSDIMEPKDRIKVLQYLIERVVGKIPDKVVVAAADPWETIIGDILSESPDDIRAQVPEYMARALKHGKE